MGIWKTLSTSKTYPCRSRIHSCTCRAGETLFSFCVDIIMRPAGQRGFIPQPQRWKVERTFAWFDWSRLLGKEYEYTISSSEADIYLASIRIMLRKLKILRQ